LVAALPTPAPADPAPSQPKPPLPAALTTSAPPRIELPTSNADYLQNNKANYPALSRRLGEQGQVMLRVLIGTDGVAQKAEISTSSGYERLDQAALATVLRWRYAPGRRAGVPETMWFSVPINFVLE
jgi:protein TonB